MSDSPTPVPGGTTDPNTRDRNATDRNAPDRNASDQGIPGTAAPGLPTSPPTAPQMRPPTARDRYVAGPAVTAGAVPPQGAPASGSWQPGVWGQSAPWGQSPAGPPSAGATPAGPPTAAPPTPAPSPMASVPAMASYPQGPPPGGTSPRQHGVDGNGGARRGGGIRAALIGGLVGAIVAGGITAAAMTVRDEPAAVVNAAPASTPSRASNNVSGEALDIRSLLDKVQPSVVSVHTGTRQGEAAGSGIVVSKDGLVLTNAHVVEGAQSIQVDFADGQTADARLIGKATGSDVALVKAEGLEGETVPAEFGSSGDLLVGDEVVAIGNALNLGAEPSVTTGIVSQTGRSITAPDGSVLDDLIQTDAAINPGNSGGPLVNAQGQVVGVNTAIVAEAQNIGFALEIDSIRDLIDDLKAGRDAEKERPVLGVSTLDVARLDTDVARRFGVTATSGAFVQDVTSGSGADAAGLLPGDVIVEVDGRTIRNSTDVGQAVRAKDAGDEIDIVVEREGEEMSVKATLGSN